MELLEPKRRWGLLLLWLVPALLSAQIRIGGNVYGGGNHAEVKGSTKVTVMAGDIGYTQEPIENRPIADPRGKVFGGARAANVGGNTFVHIDGEHATDYIVINQVFGGNDVAGTIGTARAVGEGVPDELTAVKRTVADKTDPRKDSIDDTWNTYVRISSKIATEAVYYTQAEIDAADPRSPDKIKTIYHVKTPATPAADAKKIFIGQVYAGGNGDFDYEQSEPDGSGNVTHTIYNKGDRTTPLATIVTKANEVDSVKPVIDKAYLDIEGGTISFAYGGGNSTTVNDTTVIHVDNPSEVVNHIYVDPTTNKENLAATKDSHEGLIDLISDERSEEMDINTAFNFISSPDFQVGRFFGGNNTAEMDIQPGWNLLSGKIRNLYSGGNQGAMTCPNGLLLEIPTWSSLVVDNLYGGCRMADVMPSENGVYKPTINLPGYNFPLELSARVLVRGGDVNNVYGGNDITGTVYGGNAVGIYTTVRGNVYGGGNGAYPYTDMESLKDGIVSDFYYETPDGQTSYEALKHFRPNAEQVSIRLKGTDQWHPAVVKGSVFIGGNCASLETQKKNPLVELKIGSYSIANKVFLGNNGEGMVDEDILKIYAGRIDEDGNYTTSDDGTKFSSLILTDPSVFANYMEAVAMPLQPRIVFDRTAIGDPDDYLDNTSYVGSFYCGGNVGSMTIPGKNVYKVSRGLNIFEKFVGGCNNAYVPYREGLNAAYDGGVLGSAEERYVSSVIGGSEAFFTDDGLATGPIKDRLEIDLENLTITPLRWDDTGSRLIWNTQKRGTVYTAVKGGKTLTAGNTYYTTAKGGGEFKAIGTEVADGTNYFEKGEGFVPVPNSTTEYHQVAEGTPLTEGKTYYTSAEGAGEFTATAERTADASTYEKVTVYPDSDTRLLGGNIYGGCFNSGHVNGNVTININEDVLKRDEVFGSETGPYGNRASGVELLDQRDDLEAVALILFGGGCGKDTEIWGSTTVNHNNGYIFQVCGGGEEGVIGRRKTNSDGTPQLTDDNRYVYEFDPRYSATVNLNGTTPVFSQDGTVEGLAETEYIFGGGKEGDVCGNTLVNLGNGRIYDAFGGASDADILGHAEVYIGRQPNGDGTYKDGFPWIADIVYGGNDFGGTIWGRYEDGYDFTKRIENYAQKKTMIHGYDANQPTKIPDVMKSAAYVEYLQGRVDTIFGGGYGYYDYSSDLYAGYDMPYLPSTFVNIRPKTHDKNAIIDVYGGSTGFPMNRDGDKSQDRSYVLIDIPDGVTKFANSNVYGAGSYNGLGMRFQEKTNTFDNAFDPDSLSAIIDLIHGSINNVFGGSRNEGVTARTMVNVPKNSTISLNNIFGGSYGTQILPPCDTYESNVNFNSENARVANAIYGGNNNERRTVYANVNISSPVWSNKEKGYLATVYGAGRGIDTWSEYTEVHLNKGAKVFEVYGGGEMGHVLNTESVQEYMQLYKDKPSPQISRQDSIWKDPARWTGTVGESSLIEGKLHVGDKLTVKEEWAEAWKDAWKIGAYYVPDGTYKDYLTNNATNLNNSALVRTVDMDDRDYSAYVDEDGHSDAAEIAKRKNKYNTNVIIHEGATVVNYAYGGGYGTAAVPRSGDIYGTTYIALLGGTVKKDIYAAGTSGSVCDLFGVRPYNATTKNGFTASANAYIKGGTCRNVYGGGWEGHVGTHDGDISASPAYDIPGETHVVIGDMPTPAAPGTFASGIPAIQRNAYGGGEGGAIYGKAHMKLNNGYIGYVHLSATEKQDEQGNVVAAAASEGLAERYEEKIIDETHKDKESGEFIPNTNLTDAGCIFGGGYVDNSSVDKTRLYINGGSVRNSVFGGGEIAAIGRGSMKKSTEEGKSGYVLEGIYRPGKTNIEMYGGHVYRNVYGGGRGYDNLGKHGKLHCDGYIFGQTEVHIHGGEIGTASGVADGDGNVFGGGDIGFVYSAYEIDDTHFGIGKKDGERYDGQYQGYYYKYENGDFVTVNVAGEGETPKYERQFTEDCKVLVEPHLKVTTQVTIGDSLYQPNQFVTINDLNKLKNKHDFDETTNKGDSLKWICLDQTGIIIHNAVFAGGNTPSGTLTTSANTASVFGNATASVNDIFHRDMITMGTRHTGGLYGDGNLTLVDGYRELNITNYGTDYYSIAKNINIADYEELPDREKDYYELKYTCLKDCKDKDSTLYKAARTEEGITTKASTITADDMQTLFVEEITVNGETKKQSVKKDGVDILIYDEDLGEWVPNPAEGAQFWEKSGVLPVYAGRLMNSIQRADFCGVFGSRMVMQGAQDRVLDESDFNNYTINRVREVSLNKKVSTAGDGVEHGNYFGIYNIVNYLGALTSDVDFGAIRKTENPDEKTYKADIEIDGNTYHYGGDGGATYYQWKQAHIKDKTRNNGSSHNKVALASGVYLEITTEESTGIGLYEKVWGPITGVVELDLINVSTGIGGGFVYAKNQHGKRTKSDATNTTLTELNKGAVTKWDYEYDPNDPDKEEWETSGNFVHSTQTIIDDCYNISNKYKTGYLPPDGVPAHFWYIKGSVYVYDQYISAYTGTANAYSEKVEIPLTIAAASHGTMKLLNVMPNRYAYYSSPGVPLENGKKMIINDKTYYQNDPISYWDWYLLSKSEKELFIPMTYTNCVSVSIDGGELKEAGTIVMTKEQFDAYGDHLYKNADGDTIRDANKDVAGKEYIFRMSNNVSHDEGYILSYEVNNPSIWNTWYTPKVYTTDEATKITKEAYETLSVTDKAKYEDAPTYRLKATTGGEVLGQSKYEVGDLIPKSIEDTYQAITNKPEASTQATFTQAFIVTKKITVSETTSTGTVEHHYNVGMTVDKAFADAHSSDVDTAYICTNTIPLTKEEYIYKNSKMSLSDVNKYKQAVRDSMDLIATGASNYTTEEQIKNSGLSAEKQKKLISWLTAKEGIDTYLVPAYYCTAKGLYGGNYYESGHNYRGLEAWSSMSENDREKFVFNYDVLDLLIDPDFTTADSGSGAYSEGHKYQYDGEDDDGYFFNTEEEAKTNKAGYSIIQSIDYTATYNDAENNVDLGTGRTITVKRYNSTTNKYESISTQTIMKDDELSREVFENELVNEQRHYAPIVVKNGQLVDGTYTVYVANEAFQIGSTPYALGETISAEAYESLPEKQYVTTLTFNKADDENSVYYYCREPYKIATGGHKVKSVKGTNSNSYEVGATVPIGAIISAENVEGGTGYKNLTNEQKNFTIHGISPTETSTFYVSNASDIYDLSKEKIITVIYQYDYDETDSEGNATPISERHVVNIHLQFKSGVPTVEDINKPDIILPGWYTTIREPDVKPGAYEVTGGGWELFETQREAESHTNGTEYDPTFDPLYWYQDGYYVAYYAKSYLGRTYSNAVPVSVANYHDLAEVMSDENKAHHMYIDNKDVKREPKIYINDYTTDDPATSKNGLELFKKLYDLSVLNKPSVNSDGLISSGEFTGHKPLDNHVRAGDKLQFILRTDISVPSGSPAWTPIASGEDPCFSGTLHGDGHTLSGLDHSLFGNLCGSVYNLGVTGSFATAGVADTGDGYVESCWVKTTATSGFAAGTKAVFGDPTAMDGGEQVVNCYYPESNRGTGSGSNSGYDPSGKAIAKPDRAFYNGEVAYDLNNFYLYKRYSDKNVSAGDGKVKYRYFTIGDDNQPVLQDYKYYDSHPTLCSSGYIDNKDPEHPIGLAYVEDRYDDGDFRFADGEIPDTRNKRYYTEEVTEGGQKKQEVSYYPIWPDDYIFFGQKLTYGWGDEAHQDVPTAVVKEAATVGGLLSLNDDANRVYRAPAYYRSKQMGVAHFNPKAYLAQMKLKAKPEYADTLAYPNMTAIDFAGHHDTTWGMGTVAVSVSSGFPAGTPVFYPPLLDDDGLISIRNCDETQNLVVYAPAETAESGYANKKTYDALTEHFDEPVFNMFYDRSSESSDNFIDDKVYDRVADATSQPVNGHLVQHDLTAVNDHLLVDKHDFNAPIAYTFDDSHRMWYQRKPADNEFVSQTAGWQGICLPFTATLVTTNDKGEITHFYSGSDESKNNTHTKIGHEYWLRELQAVTTEGSPAVTTANFVYPTAAGSPKTVSNTFLWDYYYENTARHNRKDANDDTYQEYYRTSRTYPAYPFLTATKPYLLGLPSQTYYEFDLSGKWEPKNTAVSITKLNKQADSFVSATGETIGVSDDEIAKARTAATKGGYTFVPTFMRDTLQSVSKDDAVTPRSYAINAEGNAYRAVTREAGDPEGTNNVVIEPFRPYFATAAAGARKRQPGQIVFSNVSDSFGEEHESMAIGDGALTITSRLRHIIVTSTMKTPQDVRITNAAGVSIKAFTILPGQTVETRVNLPGLYIVNHTKIAVR